MKLQLVIHLYLGKLFVDHKIIFRLNIISNILTLFIKAYKNVFLISISQALKAMKHAIG